MKIALLSSSPRRLAWSSSATLEEAVSPLGYKNVLFLISTLHKTVAMSPCAFSQESIFDNNLYVQSCVVNFLNVVCVQNTKLL